MNISNVNKGYLFGAMVGTFGVCNIAMAGDITQYANQEWLQAGYIWNTTEVVGVQPADPNGAGCGDNDYSEQADAPPWTFEVGPEGATLTVVDNWVLQDQYAVFDNGIHIGNTPEPQPGLSCYDLPDMCVAYGGAAEFELGEGDHSITMSVVSFNPDFPVGCLYMRLDGDVGGPAMEVGIDIQPNKVTNKVRLDETATIPVAILSHADFDARLVDQYTVTFGPDDALPVERLTRFKDVNRDGYKDILFRFKAIDTGIQCGDTEASLTAEWDGQTIVGTDTLIISPSSCR